MNDSSRERFDLDELFHPERAFGHPSEVIKDPDLTINEKRAILASSASDACAMEAAPESVPTGTVHPCASTISWRRCETSTRR